MRKQGEAYNSRLVRFICGSFRREGYRFLKRGAECLVEGCGLVGRLFWWVGDDFGFSL